MILFNGCASNDKFKSKILMHAGSCAAAAHRLESMFAAQKQRIFINGHYFVLGANGQREAETVEQALTSFCDYLKHCKLVELDADIKSPLEVNDSWDDDPVGSAGMQLFQGNAALSTQQIMSLGKLFYPFSGVIYPHDIYSKLSESYVKKMCRSYNGNTFFQEQMANRKARLIAIGRYSAQSMLHEAVWIDLTLKFRIWALQSGFDSLSYKNEREGGGDDSFVMLKPNQLRATSHQYVFDKAKYMETVQPIFLSFLNQFNRPAGGDGIKPIPVIPSVFWAGINPTEFWHRERA